MVSFICRSATARHLGGSSDSRGGGRHVLGLGLGLRLSLGRDDLLGSLLGLGLVLDGLILDDGLLDLGLLSSLLLGLGGRGLAVDGSSELGEGALATLLPHLTLGLPLGGSRGLITLAESERKRRLALLLDILLGLNDGGRGNLSRLNGDVGGVGDVDSEGGGGLDRRDHGGVLSSLNSVLGSLDGLSGLDLGALLLLAGEDTEDAVALGGNGLLLGGLGLVLLDSGGSLGNGSLLCLGGLDHGSGLGGGLNRGNGSNDRGDNGSGLKRNDGSLSDSRSLGGRSISDGSLLSRLDLILLVLLLVGGRVALTEAEERSSLAAGRSALGLLRLDLLLLALLLGGLLGHDIVNGDDLLGLGLLLLGSLGNLLLLLSNGSGLVALSGGLVVLGLADGWGKLLGLCDLELQLCDPVVALSSVGGLEAVLVTLGGEVELVGAIGLGLGGISLWGASLD